MLDPLAERRRHSRSVTVSRPSRSNLQTPQDSRPHHLGRSTASSSNRRVRIETPACAELNCHNRDVRPDSEYCTSKDRCRTTHSHPGKAFLSTCYRQKGHDGFHHLKSQDLCYHWSYDDKTGSVSALQPVRAAAVVATRINSMPARDNTYMKQAAEKPPQFNPHSTASASGHQLKTRPSYRRLQYDSDRGQQLLSGHEHGSDHSHRARPSNRDSPAAAATDIAQAGMAAIDPGTAQLQRAESSRCAREIKPRQSPLRCMKRERFDGACYRCLLALGHNEGHVFGELPETGRPATQERFHAVSGTSAANLKPYSRISNTANYSTQASHEARPTAVHTRHISSGRTAHEQTRPIHSRWRPNVAFFSTRFSERHHSQCASTETTEVTDPTSVSGTAVPNLIKEPGSFVARPCRNRASRHGPCKECSKPWVSARVTAIIAAF